MSSSKTPNRLVRKSKQNMDNALKSLEQAFLTEAARQEHERMLEFARITALHQRQTTLQIYPFSWPATMTQEMESHYGNEIVKKG
jgi:hypothetical protein